jgi:hypothetical protein
LQIPRLLLLLRLASTSVSRRREAAAALLLRCCGGVVAASKRGEKARTTRGVSGDGACDERHDAARTVPAAKGNSASLFLTAVSKFKIFDCVLETKNQVHIYQPLEEFNTHPQCFPMQRMGIILSQH